MVQSHNTHNISGLSFLFAYFSWSLFLLFLNLTPIVPIKWFREHVEQFLQGEHPRGRNGLVGARLSSRAERTTVGF